jgi:hypothetical protein
MRQDNLGLAHVVDVFFIQTVFGLRKFIDLRLGISSVSSPTHNQYLMLKDMMSAAEVDQCVTLILTTCL